MNSILKSLTLLIISLMVISTVYAQSECPQLVKQALELTGTACAQLSVNQVCYGHTNMTLEAHAEDAPIIFAKPGDRVPVTDLKSLQIGSMDEAQAEWVSHS